MKPYYDHGGITIYHGDCREILPELPKVDLVLTDPPYGINYKGGRGGNLIHSKLERKSERIIGDDVDFDPSFLIARPPVALFGAHNYCQKIPTGGTFHIWDKRGKYEQVHTSDFDTIWISKKEVGRIYRCVWRGLCRESEYTQKIFHPTQKPQAVVKWIIERFENIQFILDPYVGGGTTLLVAKNTGRKATGIEIEEKYCEIAARRLGQEVLPFG